MRKCIMTFGVIVSLLSGAVFLVQGLVENRNFYGQLEKYAWQFTSLQLAELNTGRRQFEQSEQYSLVTDDYGAVRLELEFFSEGTTIPEFILQLDPSGRLSRSETEHTVCYSGTFTHDEQEYYRAIHLIFRSSDTGAYHLTPKGDVVGFFSLAQPISAAKKALFLSHVTKVGMWLGISATFWFLLIGIGGKLIRQLERVNAKLVDAERNGIINKVVCTYNHRINSPLMGIYGSVELLEEIEKDPRKTKLIRSVSHAADRIKEATDQIAALESYRFVNYVDEAQMLDLVGTKGKAGTACHSSRSVGYRVGLGGSPEKHRVEN